METVQVRSKSFVIRWVHCEPGNNVSWKVHPEKKSINMGVFQFDHAPKSVETEVGSDVNLAERLISSGGQVLIEIERRSGGITARGECQPRSQVLAFVFDNTFSKNTSKTVNFSFDVEHVEVIGSLNNLTFKDQSLTNLTGPVVSSDNRFLNGNLLKRKRKKLQGFAKRYFSLDTKRGLLNYYLDNRSSTLRGVMPVKICDISFDNCPLIVLDSGVETWHLKAFNKSDWDTWKNALQTIRNVQFGRMLSREPSINVPEMEESPEWREIAFAVGNAVAATKAFVAGGHAEDGPAKQLVEKLQQSFETIQEASQRHFSEAFPVISAGAQQTSAAPTSVPVAGIPGGRQLEPILDEEEDIFYDAEDDGESDLSSVDSSDSESKYNDDDLQMDSFQDDDLYPLNEVEASTQRRVQVPKCEHNPPSLLSLLRKSGDLGNMSVPVTSNEPIGVLQKMAEAYEYSELLDKAAAASGAKRVLLVAVFCITNLSSVRVKERSIRKPFNPMLGEVFELVRADKGFRFIAEKVSHRPPIFASEVESKNWHVVFTSRPYQKVWGKSAEIGDTGDAKVIFPDGESVEYTIPDCFLRNLIAGEKYVEPVGTTVVSSSQGIEATIEFKAGGMFSGRSEEVKISCGNLVAEGKWTEQVSCGGETLWKVGPLVSQPKDHYGWPQFTASLNEVTPIEKGVLCPNDSRVRPDQQAYERQDIKAAEDLKLKIETGQRQRRKEYEQQGKSWEPVFFTSGHNLAGAFTQKSGAQNYWQRRRQQDWEGIVRVLE